MYVDRCFQLSKLIPKYTNQQVRFAGVILLKELHLRDAFVNVSTKLLNISFNFILVHTVLV